MKKFRIASFGLIAFVLISLLPAKELFAIDNYSENIVESRYFYDQTMFSFDFDKIEALNIEVGYADFENYYFVKNDISEGYVPRVIGGFTQFLPWQVSFCPYPLSNEDAKTLLEDGQITFYFGAAEGSFDESKFVYSKLPVGFTPEDSSTGEIDYLYIVSTMSNKEAMVQLDAAMSLFLNLEPEFLIETIYSFYPQYCEDVVEFNDAEKAFIESTKEHPVRVCLANGYAPISSKNKNGKFEGIIPDCIETISNLTGINFEIVDFDASLATEDIVKSGKVDLIPGINLSLDASYKYDVKFVNTLGKISISKVYYGDASGGTGYYGVVSKDFYTGSVLSKSLSLTEIRYKTVEDCIEALRKGYIDFAYMPEYCAQYQVASDYTNRLVYTTDGNDTIDLSFAVVNSDNALLMSVINKSVFLIRGVEYSAIVSKNTAYKADSFSIIGYIYDHPLSVWIIAIVMAIIIIGFSAILLRSKVESGLKKKNNEFSVALSGMFNIADFIIEIDIADNMFEYYTYSLDKGADGIVNDICKNKVKEGADPLSRIYSEDIDKFRYFLSLENCSRVVKSQNPAVIDVRALNDDNEAYSYYYVTLTPFEATDDKKKQLLLTVRNIDRVRRENEEKRKTLILALDTARKASESKSAFLSQMSHDIRTPLNAIMGMSQVAFVNHDDIAKRDECLDAVMRSSETLLELINELLDMSAIERGKLVVSNVRLDIGKLFDDVCRVASANSEKKNVKFDYNATNLRHYFIYSDQLKLEQIFNNIISNAIKYTEAGNEIEVTLEEIESNEDNKFYFNFIVKDSGIGMDKAMLSRVFTPFERAEEVKFIPGTGLGLSITKSLVDAMGGMMSIDSVLGVGTTVTVSLCFGVDDNVSENVCPAVEGRKAILICDDLNLRNTLMSYFDELNMKVTFFGNIHDAINALEIVSDKDSNCLVVISTVAGFEEDSKNASAIRKLVGDNSLILLAPQDDNFSIMDVDYEHGLDGILSVPVYKSSFYRALEYAIKKSNNKGFDLERTGAGKRILIVEDVEINRIFAESIVEMKGFVSDYAENGKEAVEKLENSADNYYSCVLMDIQMPVMNGYEATERIRKSNREYLKNIPIIAMSANSYPEDVLKSKASGMNDHISKPVDIKRFSLVVDEYIK